MSKDDDTPEERARVYAKIAPLILAYASANAGSEFHAEDLRQYVLLNAPEIAPASPDRILRQLRLEGILDYTVLNRRASLYQFHNGDPEMNEITPKPADLVAQYIQLRDARDVLEDKLKDKMLNFTRAMEDIEARLLKYFNDTGVDNLTCRGIGNAHRKKKTSVTTADMREFRRHVIGTEDWELADFKPNKTRVDEMAEAGEPLPPGVNRTARYVVSISKREL